MELSTSQALLYRSQNRFYNRCSSQFGRRTRLPLNPTMVPLTNLGLRQVAGVSVRAGTSEETATRSAELYGEGIGGTVESKDDDRVGQSIYDETLQRGSSKEESPVDEQTEGVEFLDKLNAKRAICECRMKANTERLTEQHNFHYLSLFLICILHFLIMLLITGTIPWFSLVDSGDAVLILIYGGGALFTLWLASAVVGAIDSIPVFPKLMEVVGLAYSIWFTTRYLLFKRNRDELGAKLEELKREVLGIDE